MKKLNIFFAWVNYQLSYWTTNGRKTERIVEYYTEYMNAKYLNTQKK